MVYRWVSPQWWYRWNLNCRIAPCLSLTMGGGARQLKSCCSSSINQRTPIGAVDQGCWMNGTDCRHLVVCFAHHKKRMIDSRDAISLRVDQFLLRPFTQPVLSWITPNRTMNYGTLPSMLRCVMSWEPSWGGGVANHNYSWSQTHLWKWTAQLWLTVDGYE